MLYTSYLHLNLNLRQALEHRLGKNKRNDSIKQYTS